MTEIGLSRGGPPETILPDLFPEAAEALAAALEIADENARRDAVSEVVAHNPRFIDGWARLGELGRHPIERYAAFRVGYHRGLDTLRQNGWRGSGFVRWEHPTNRGFLRALAGLQTTASEIGEVDEDERCSLFLRQLDPAWPPADFS
jgi:hypothetical protein